MKKKNLKKMLLNYLPITWLFLMTVFYLVVRFNIINTSEIDRSAIELLSTLGWISVGYDENIIETLLLYSLITGVFFMFSLWYLSSKSALEDKKEFKADSGGDLEDGRYN